MGKNFCKIEGKWCKLCQSHGSICKFNGDANIADIRRCPKRVSEQTIRLKDYVQDVSIDDMMEGMAKWWPSQVSDDLKESYAKVLDYVKTVKADVSEWKIRVEKVHEDEVNDERFGHMDAHDWLSTDAFIPNSKYGYYSIEFEPWKHWAGMNIAQETLDSDLSKNEIVAAIFYEMTFSGFDEETIKETQRKIYEGFEECRKIDEANN